MKEDIRTEKTESYGRPVGTRVRLIHRRHTWCGCSHASESRAGMKRDGPPEGLPDSDTTDRKCHLLIPNPKRNLSYGEHVSRAAKLAAALPTP